MKCLSFLRLLAEGLKMGATSPHLYPKHYDGDVGAQAKPSTTGREYGSRHKEHQSAFTLAEVLITLSIIGVVAALTIPSLIVKKQKEEFVVGLQKNYSAISNAMHMANLNNSFEEIKFPLEGHWQGEESLKILQNYLKITKICPARSNNTKECYDQNLDMPRATLTDGSYLYCHWVSPITEESYIVRFFIDVNGAKGPNKAGRDIFVVGYSAKTKKILPYQGGDNNYSDQELMDQCFKDGKLGSDPYNCAYKIISEGWKMNY